MLTLFICWRGICHHTLPCAHHPETIQYLSDFNSTPNLDQDSNTNVTTSNFLPKFTNRNIIIQFKIRVNFFFTKNSREFLLYFQYQVIDIKHKITI